jgi:adenylate cyclase
MSYRIGIGIGDVVERDGDLLGDGVNIAARLEGLAEPGGICISRAVYEQVTNKLSARFIDIGARKVKNIPEPVHAYLVATWDDGRAYGRRRHATPASAKIGQEVAFGSRSSAPSRWHCGSCFLSCKPEARRQGLSNSTAAVTRAAGIPTSPPPAPRRRHRRPIASPPTSPTPVPAVRRANSAMKRSGGSQKRSLQSCSACDSTRLDWRHYETERKDEHFIAECMKAKSD